MRWWQRKGPADDQVPGDLGLQLRLMTPVTEAPSKVKEVIPERDALLGPGGREAPGNRPLGSDRWVLGSRLKRSQWRGWERPAGEEVKSASKDKPF